MMKAIKYKWHTVPNFPAFYFFFTKVTLNAHVIQEC